MELGGYDRLLAWTRRYQRHLLILAAAAQLLILAAMVALRAIPLMTGQTVLVRVVPVDPRDLFRGDYVILSYPFSRLVAVADGGVNLWPDQSSSWNHQGETVYLKLQPDPDGRHSNAERWSLAAPTDGLYLRGQIQSYNQVTFGIEAFYLQESTGAKFEEAIRNRQLSAELAITRSGQAVLRRLIIE